ncbi:MAG: ABC transporter ATP-binding protein [Firmicutes bacterium]|nr:ABC transporter ATP-binding protein [Bacillota bacterium]
MFEKIKQKYYLSDAEANLIKQGVIFNALSNISKMLPVGICTYVLSQMFSSTLKTVESLPIMTYLVISLISVGVMIVLSYAEYTKTFIDIYKEGANRRTEITEFLRKLPLAFFSKRDIADVTTIIMTDISGIEHALAHVIPQYYGTIISTIIVCIAMSVLNYKLALVLFWVIPIALLVVKFSRKLQEQLASKFKEVKLNSSDQIQSTLEMIKEIKSFSLEKDHKEVIKNQLNNFEQIQRKTELFSATILASAQMILNLGTATVIVVGSLLLLKGEIALFTYIVFLFSAGLVYEPVHSLMNSLTEIFSTDVLLKRINDIMSQDVEANNSAVDDSNMEISFKNVSFGYNDTNVLNKVTFRAEKGKKTALVGASGSGKSTVLKLAAGFYKPKSGEIYLGDQDISKLNSESLLKNYGVVFQDVLLFDNTIMENIRLGNKDATDDEVINAAKLANCHDFIVNLENGYNTYIGENGKMLSGGEKQRLSIARAIIKDAPIVLLDEVTSALDIENESLVQDAINHITRDKTVIIIAHKLNTIKECDKILVLNEGEIVEKGTHNQLLQLNNYYSRLRNINRHVEV